MSSSRIWSRELFTRFGSDDAALAINRIDQQIAIVDRGIENFRFSQIDPTLFVDDQQPFLLVRA